MLPSPCRTVPRLVGCVWPVQRKRNRGACYHPTRTPSILTAPAPAPPQAKGCNWDSAINGAPAGAGTQFAADYTRMITLFKALPSKPKVFVVLPPPGISQCGPTGPAGNATVCLAYNMSFHAINDVFPVLQRQIAKDAGADGVIDVWSALNGTACTTLPPSQSRSVSVPPCPHTIDGIHPYPDAHMVIAETIAAVITNGTAAPSA